MDFKRFWSRFRYSYPSCEYIRIIEPQGNGSYHLHVLMKRMDKQDLFVPMKKLKQMWEYGGAWIENLPFVENFGAYLCPKFLKESTTPADTVSKAYEKELALLSIQNISGCIAVPEGFRNLFLSL